MLFGAVCLDIIINYGTKGQATGSHRAGKVIRLLLQSKRGSPRFGDTDRPIQYKNAMSEKRLSKGVNRIETGSTPLCSLPFTLPFLTFIGILS
ncbi:hypothetical protein D4R75_15710 [bacterium]|nr:MAG: hypothetical protein D4R75_15710 [bacterium]